MDIPNKEKRKESAERDRIELLRAVRRWRKRYNTDEYYRSEHQQYGIESPLWSIREAYKEWQQTGNLPERQGMGTWKSEMENFMRMESTDYKIREAWGKAACSIELSYRYIPGVDPNPKESPTEEQTSVPTAGEDPTEEITQTSVGKAPTAEEEPEFPENWLETVTEEVFVDVVGHGCYLCMPQADRPKPPIDEIIPALQPGTVCLLAAPGGTGKTYFAMELCIAIATGQNILENLPIKKQGSTCLVTFEESPESVIRRGDFVAQFLKEKGMICPNDPEIYAPLSFFGRKFSLLDQNYKRDEEHIKAITHLCAGRRLLVLDSLSYLHRINENDNVQASELMMILTEIARDTKCAIMVIHHTNKGATLNGTGNTAESVRGASAFKDTARLMLTLSKHPKKENWIELTWAKTNGVRPDPINLERTFNGVLTTPYNERNYYRNKRIRNEYKEI